jgi:hypothetical protein
VRIWDTLLADPGGRLDCLLRVCLALLLNVRQQLLAGACCRSRRLLGVHGVHGEGGWEYTCRGGGVPTSGAEQLQEQQLCSSLCADCLRSGSSRPEICVDQHLVFKRHGLAASYAAASIYAEHCICCSAPAGDFAVIVKTLQRYPSVDVDVILRAAARLPPCSSILA